MNVYNYCGIQCVEIISYFEAKWQIYTYDIDIKCDEWYFSGKRRASEANISVSVTKTSFLVLRSIMGKIAFEFTTQKSKHYVTNFLPLSPPGWRGIVVTVRAGGRAGGRTGGRAGGRLPDLRNPYLCNRLMDFLHSKFYGIV